MTHSFPTRRSSELSAGDDHTVSVLSKPAICWQPALTTRIWWSHAPNTISGRPSPLTSPSAGVLKTPSLKPSGPPPLHWSNLSPVWNAQRFVPLALSTTTPPCWSGTSSEPTPTTTSARPSPSRSPTAGDDATAVAPPLPTAAIGPIGREHV